MAFVKAAAKVASRAELSRKSVDRLRLSIFQEKSRVEAMTFKPSRAGGITNLCS